MPRTTKKPSMRATSKLSKAQEGSLKRHAKKHSSAHMKYMKRRMLMGDTFRQAHKKAADKVGK